MKVNSIKTVGFRKFKDEFKTKLYDITSITGRNTSGKTNILYAIVWAFHGTNLTGDERVWLGHNDTENFYVELEFTDNDGYEHTLVRSKNKYDNKRNFIMLDNREIKQEDLIRFYKDKKLFLSIVNPSYFINKKPAEQKELIDKYLPNIDIKEVYDKLDNKDKKTLTEIPTDIVRYMTELRDDKKLKEDSIKKLKGKIEYAQNIINIELDNKQDFLKEEELALAREELSFFISNSKNADKTKQETIVKSLESQVIKMEEQIKELELKMKVGKQKYLSIKNESESFCPMCNQKIENEAKAETIKNMKEDLENAFNTKNKLDEEITSLKLKLQIEKCNLYSMQQSSVNESELKALQDKVKVLEQEKINIETFNKAIEIKQTDIEKAKNDITKFRQEIVLFENSIDEIKKTIKTSEKLYINYIEEKMKFATRHLKDVKIRFYSVLKETGELKEDFIITYKDNEFKNLSKSESIATSLEISNMFNKISEVNLPLFIDDTESCADYNFIEQYADNSQILIAKVNKGQELQINDYSESISESYLKVA